jgi:choline dehydrogenase-like flavoprotein
LFTARMSADPRTAVTNPCCRTRDIKKLFISNGSALSTPSGANPTLTIVALALRQSEHIAVQLKSGEL